jgi:hypothetical protein
MIGCYVWILVLGRFDKAYATSAMGTFDMLSREGYLKAVKRILSYLKTFPKGRLIINTAYLDHSLFLVEYLIIYMQCYPDTEEEISNDLPVSRGPKIRMTVYVDADHAHDLVTR